MSEVKSPWPTLPLGQIASEMCLGKMLDKEKNRGVLQPYLRNVNVRWFAFDLADLKEMRFEDNEVEKFSLRRGDLVICEGGEPGRAAVWGGQIGQAKIQKALHRVRFRESEFDPYFAMYYLYFGTLSKRFEEAYTGTTISHLTGKALQRLPFPVPPINEQRRIVAKVEELFSVIDAGLVTLKKVQAKLKRYRASVLKAAVEGKLTEAWRTDHPPSEPAAALVTRILVDRRRRWGEAQRAKFTTARKEPPKNWEDNYAEPTGPNTAILPSLPNGWCWTTVEQLLAEPSCNGISVRGSETPPGVPALRLSAMTDTGFDYSKKRYIPISHEVATSLAVAADDFFVCRGNGSLHLVGRGTLAQQPPEKVVFPDTMIRLRFLSSAGPCRYFALAWQSRWIKSQVAKKARTTAGIYKVSQTDLDGFIVPVPPVNEQAAIVEEVEARLCVIDKLTSQVDANLKRAARLRQSVLKRAFEGKLVPQYATDEPATALLERIRRPVVLATVGVKPGRRNSVLGAFAELGRMIAYVIENAHRPFGRKALVKVFYVGQTHLGIPLRQSPKRGEYGPIDFDIYKVERVARKQGWFDFREQAGERERTTYSATPSTPAASAEAAAFLGERKAAFDQLLAHFDTLTSDGAELFATAYAAWNDLLIDGRPADESAVVAEVHGWNPSKAKFSAEAIVAEIARMRATGYVPTGRGERTAAGETPPARKRGGKR